jgi:hypothetical protein
MGRQQHARRAVGVALLLGLGWYAGFTWRMRHSMPPSVTSDSPYESIEATRLQARVQQLEAQLLHLRTTTVRPQGYEKYPHNAQPGHIENVMEDGVSSRSSGRPSTSGSIDGGIEASLPLEHPSSSHQPLKVGILVASISPQAAHSGEDWIDLNDSSLVKIMLRSLERTVVQHEWETMDIRLFCALDNDDLFWRKNSAKLLVRSL